MIETLTRQQRLDYWNGRLARFKEQRRTLLQSASSIIGNIRGNVHPDRSSAAPVPPETCDLAESLKGVVYGLIDAEQSIAECQLALKQESEEPIPTPE